MQKITPFIIAFCLMAIATSVYLFRLGTIPEAFHGDEAETALEALRILRGLKGLIGVGWYDIPLLAFTPHAVTMWLFGETIFGSRMGSVVFGVLTLPLYFLLSRHLFTTRVALFTTILLAMSHTFIALTRVGTIYMQAGFITVGFFYFFLTALKTNRISRFVLAGIFCGLCIYTYYAARAAPLILLFFLPGYLIALKHKRAFLRSHVLPLMVFIVTTGIVLAPQIRIFLSYPPSLTSRTKEVFLFSQQNKEWIQSTYQTTSPITAFIGQTLRSGNITLGDNSGQYGYKGMLFDIGTVLLFAIGCVVGFRKRSLYMYFAFLWLLLPFLIGQILTIPPGFLPRFVVGLPAVFLFAGIGLDALLLFVRGKKIPLLPVAAFILTGIITANLYTYFFLYPKEQQQGIAGDPNALAATRIAKTAERIKPRKLVFVTIPQLYANFSTLRYLSPNILREDYDSTSLSNLSSENVTEVLFVVHSMYHEQLQYLTTTYPHGTFILNHSAYPMYYVNK